MLKTADTLLSPQEGGTQSANLLRTAQVRWNEPDAIACLSNLVGGEDLALLHLLVSPDADFKQVIAQASDAFPGTDVVACTTAGEIGVEGYDEGLIVAIGWPTKHFASNCTLIEGLDDLNHQELADSIIQKRLDLQKRNTDKENGFAFLLVDGLSLKEDVLAAALSPALAGLPLFGGSAGDGVDFEVALVALNGQIQSNAAVLALIATDCKTRVFSLNHLVPTEQHMVVTDADPGQRIVKEINAEPAAREYARIVGKDPEQLDPFTFASHPVVVRIGGSHHVRAIQRVNSKGELVFFSAIDEGMVLTVANSESMAAHLEDELSALTTSDRPGAIIGCDCILRRIEAEQTQIAHSVSSVLSRHKVIGFSTYGEQIGPLHVNHTMTGVAIYPHPPPSDL